MSKMRTLTFIIVCSAAVFLVYNLVFSKNHNIVVQHYDVTKTEYVFCKNVTEGKDIRVINEIIQNAEWEKYYLANNDNVRCQFYFDNGNGKAILYQVVNEHEGFILVQKDANLKSSLVGKNLELIIDILQ